MIVDSHAHLDMSHFDEDRDAVLARAREAGIEILVTVGTAAPDRSSLQRTLEFLDAYDFVYGAVGVHPHDARQADHAFLEGLKVYADHPKVRLWGEIGLDYHYDFSPRDRQIEVFRKQLGLARSLELPVSIHCRDAWDDLIAILEQDWLGCGSPGVLHSFTGSGDAAERCLAMDFFLSFSGIVTFKNAEPLREVARTVPIERVLVETDSPYLAPTPHRGRRNEPAFVLDVARGLAGSMGVSFESMCRHATRNLRRLLGLELEVAS